MSYPKRDRCHHKAPPLTMDEYPILLRNDYFVPERYGYPSDMVRAYILDGDRRYLNVTIDYVDLAWDEIFRVFCSSYRDFLSDDT